MNFLIFYFFSAMWEPFSSNKYLFLFVDAHVRLQAEIVVKLERAVLAHIRVVDDHI